MKALLPPRDRLVTILLPPNPMIDRKDVENAVQACAGHPRVSLLRRALGSPKDLRPLSELVTVVASLPCKLAARFLLEIAETCGRTILERQSSACTTAIAAAARREGWAEPVHLLQRYLVGDDLPATGQRRLSMCREAA